MALPQNLTDALAKVDATLGDLSEKQQTDAAAKTAAAQAHATADAADKTEADAAGAVAAAHQQLAADVAATKAILDQLGA